MSETGRNKTASKRAVNFLDACRVPFSPLKFAAALALIIAAAALFSLTAVSGRLKKISEAENGLSELTRELERIEAECADYNEIKREYDRYSFSGYDSALPDRLEVLGLLERDVFPKAEVKSIAVSGRSLSVTAVGLGLDGASELIGLLEEEPLVESVAVSTATEGGSTVTKLTVTLAESEGSGDE